MSLPPSSPGDNDNYCSLQFNLLTVIFIVTIYSKPPEKRPIVLRWLITVLGSLCVVSGTLQRTAKINGWVEWQEDVAYEIQHYFKQSLASWIACIIVDGYLVLNLSRAYKGRRRKILHDFFANWTVTETAEKVGLFISIVSMINLAFDVHENFNSKTSDTSHHVWFICCVVCKILRVTVQGGFLDIYADKGSH